MKVTDTHTTAAEHFDYLDAETLQEVAREDARHRTLGHDEAQADLAGQADLLGQAEQAGLAELTDLVEATGPVRTGTQHLTARSA